MTQAHGTIGTLASQPPETDDAAAIHGLLAEYTTPEALVEAATRAYAEGYRKMDAYSPMPVEGLAEAIGFTHNSLPLLVLLGENQLPAERRRPPAGELAGVRADHVRADGPVRGVRGRLRDARPERTADAVPPGVQRPRVRDGVAEPVLPLRRGARPEVPGR